MRCKSYREIRDIVRLCRIQSHWRPGSKTPWSASDGTCPHPGSPVTRGPCETHTTGNVLTTCPSRTTLTVCALERRCLFWRQRSPATPPVQSSRLPWDVAGKQRWRCSRVESNRGGHRKGDGQRHRGQQALRCNHVARASEHVELVHLAHGRCPWSVPFAGPRRSEPVCVLGTHRAQARSQAARHRRSQAGHEGPPGHVCSSAATSACCT